jgi:hypothetical protein
MVVKEWIETTVRLLRGGMLEAQADIFALLLGIVSATS